MKSGDEKASGSGKNYRVSLIGQHEHRTVHGIKFTKGEATNAATLRWTDEQLAEARKDPFLVIEPLDEAGKVFVPRRNSGGQVVAEGREHIPPVVRKRTRVVGTDALEDAI